MESRHLGLQAAVRQGPGLRGLPRAAVLLEGRDPAVQPRDCAWTTTSTSTARTSRHGRPSPSRREPGPALPASGARLDDHPVDAADQPGARRRARHRVRSPVDRSRPVRRARSRQLPARRRPAGRYAKDLGSATRADAAAHGPRSRHATPAPSSPACATTRSFDYFAREYGENAWRSWSPTTSPPTTAPASCTRPPPTARTTRRSATPPASAGAPGRRAARSSRRCCPARAEIAGMQVFDANKPITQVLGARRAAWSARPATSTPTRTAGAAATR